MPGRKCSRSATPSLAARSGEGPGGRRAPPGTDAPPGRPSPAPQSSRSHPSRATARRGRGLARCPHQGPSLARSRPPRRGLPDRGGSAPRRVPFSHTAKSPRGGTPWYRLSRSASSLETARVRPSRQRRTARRSRAVTIRYQRPRIRRSPRPGGRSRQYSPAGQLPAPRQAVVDQGEALVERVTALGKHDVVAPRTYGEVRGQDHPEGPDHEEAQRRRAQTGGPSRSRAGPRPCSKNTWTSWWSARRPASSATTRSWPAMRFTSSMMMAIRNGCEGFGRQDKGIPR